MRKNLFKKVLALTLASTMAFSMAGCGSKGGSSDAKNDDGTITLNTMLQAGHYQLEEIDCSEGYLLNKEPLKFELKKDMEGGKMEWGMAEKCRWWCRK